MPKHMQTRCCWIPHACPISPRHFAAFASLSSLFAKEARRQLLRRLQAALKALRARAFFILDFVGTAQDVRDRQRKAHWDPSGSGTVSSTAARDSSNCHRLRISFQSSIRDRAPYLLLSLLTCCTSDSKRVFQRPLGNRN